MCLAYVPFHTTVALRTKYPFVSSFALCLDQLIDVLAICSLTAVVHLIASPGALVCLAFSLPVAESCLCEFEMHCVN